jgi:hypothetical protein
MLLEDTMQTSSLATLQAPAYRILMQYPTRPAYRQIRDTYARHLGKPDRTSKVGRRWRQTQRRG